MYFQSLAELASLGRGGAGRGGTKGEREQFWISQAKFCGHEIKKKYIIIVENNKLTGANIHNLVQKLANS